MKTKYYDPKKLNPNKVMKFKLNPRGNAKNYVRQKRGKR